MKHAFIRPMFVIALATGTLVRCECEEPQEFVPGATYIPDAVLDFGRVAVSSEKTLPIVVRSNGGAPLVIEAANLASGDANIAQKFIVNVREDLLDGLSPSKSSSITVTYRPCPAAWNGSSLNPAFNLNSCPSALDSADLNVLDNAPRQDTVIALNGQPVQPPVLDVACSSTCNEMMPTFGSQSCTVLRFGDVNVNDPPCDLVLEIRNKLNNGKLTGELNVKKMEIKVVNIDDINETVVDGAVAGFSLVDMNGMPLTVSAESPLVVPAPVNETTPGTKRIKVRFTGASAGSWNGSMNRKMSGLRIFSDDPDPAKQPKYVSVTGSGSAPEIDVNPLFLSFGDVEQGTSKSLMLTVGNSGNTNLRISDLRFRNDVTMSKFRVMPPAPLDIPQNGTQMLNVTYSPPVSGFDVDDLLIGSNDADERVVEVRVTGGAEPRIRVEPDSELTFPLNAPPPRNNTFTISNVGFGDLVIQRFEMTGPDDMLNHPAVDDFMIQGCSGNPCTPTGTTMLCPPSRMGCGMGSFTSFTVTYMNNDASATDLVNLKIYSNDPRDPTHVLVLSAEDNPCFFPTPVITVVTAQPRCNMPVMVDASSSMPGGPPGMPATINSYMWSWIFSPAGTPAFTPPNTAGTSFTPTAGGVYILGLDVSNSCGSSSQTPAQEAINVACP